MMNARNSVFLFQVIFLFFSLCNCELDLSLQNFTYTYHENNTITFNINVKNIGTNISETSEVKISFIDHLTSTILSDIFNVTIDPLNTSEIFQKTFELYFLTGLEDGDAISAEITTADVNIRNNKIIISPFDCDTSEIGIISNSGKGMIFSTNITCKQGFLRTYIPLIWTTHSVIGNSSTVVSQTSEVLDLRNSSGEAKTIVHSLTRTRIQNILNTELELRLTRLDLFIDNNVVRKFVPETPELHVSSVKVLNNISENVIFYIEVENYGFTDASFIVLSIRGEDPRVDNSLFTLLDQIQIESIPYLSKANFSWIWKSSATSGPHNVQFELTAKDENSNLNNEIFLKDNTLEVLVNIVTNANILLDSSSVVLKTIDDKSVIQLQFENTGTSTATVSGNIEIDDIKVASVLTTCLPGMSLTHHNLKKKYTEGNIVVTFTPRTLNTKTTTLSVSNAMKNSPQDLVCTSTNILPLLNKKLIGTLKPHVWKSFDYSGSKPLRLLGESSSMFLIYVKESSCPTPFDYDHLFYPTESRGRYSVSICLDRATKGDFHFSFSNFETKSVDYSLRFTESSECSPSLPEVIDTNSNSFGNRLIVRIIFLFIGILFL